MGGSIFARIRDGCAAAYAALTEPVFTIITMNTPPGEDREKSGRIVSQRGRKYKRCGAARQFISFDEIHAKISAKITKKLLDR